MTDSAPPDFQTIRLQLDGAVATLTLNRPHRLNAAPPLMFAEIGLALSTLPGLGARALVITGEGRAFCSGADLQDVRSRDVAGEPAPDPLADAVTALRGRGAGAFEALNLHYNPALKALALLPMPVICAVNGPAAGIGCSLALAGDFTIAGQSAYFLEAFVNIGLVPDGGATWMVARQIGKSRAMQMLMLGERIGAQQAVDWGLIYQAVPDDQLQAAAKALAQRLAAGPTRAYALLRQGMARALELSYADALAMEAEHQMQAGSTADAAEGARAFVERRKPQFQGR